MGTALSPGRCLVGISSPEVDRGEKWVRWVVVKGKGSTDDLLGYRVLFHYPLTM